MAGPWEKYQAAAQPAAPSTALPAPGDPTAFSGYTPAGNTTPSRLSPDTMRAFAIDLMANNGKGGSAILNNDPGSQYAKKYATETASNNADLANLQNATQPLLRRIEDFRDIARNAGPDVLTKATGPDYSGGYSYLPLPNTSSQMYQNVRQFFQHLNPFSDQESYKKATDANLEMQHLKDAIAASFKQLPGAGKGGATDQAQRTVDNMLGHALQSQDPETFFKIAHDAMNTVRGFARLPDLPASDAAPRFNSTPTAATAQAAMQGRTSFLPPQQQTATAAPTRAINPQTGHAIEWNGQQWVDAQ
jgi:hypothetical protein